MICPYCGEEITGAHQYDDSTGMCKDHYEEKDMDRFVEAGCPKCEESGCICHGTKEELVVDYEDGKEVNRYYRPCQFCTPQASQSDTGCSYRVWSHEHGEWLPSLRTTLLTHHPLLEGSVVDEMAIRLDLLWEGMDKHIPEPEPQQSPPEADKEDK